MRTGVLSWSFQKEFLFFSQSICRLLYLQKTLGKCNIVYRTDLITSLQTCSSSCSPLFQFHLLLSPRTVAQDRNFQVIFDTFSHLVSLWPTPKGHSRNLSHSNFLQMSLLSTSKFNSLLGVPLCFKISWKMGFPILSHCERIRSWSPIPVNLLPWKESTKKLSRLKQYHLLLFLGDLGSVVLS